MENNNLNENEETNLEEKDLEQRDNKIEETKISENPFEEQKEDKKNNILIISIIGILILLIGGYFVLSKVLVKEDNKPNETEQKEEKENDEEKKEDVEELNYTLNVYKRFSGYLCIEYNSNYCKDIAFTIKTKTEDTKVLAFDNEYDSKFMLYKDSDELKVYNLATKKSEIINFELGHKEYRIYPDEANKKIIGIVYKTQGDKIGYYNINTKQSLYEGKYDLENIYELVQINDNYLSINKEKNTKLLSNHEEKEYLAYKSSADYGLPLLYNSFGTSNKYLFALQECMDECRTIAIYSNDKKELFKGDNPIDEKYISYYNNLLYINDKNIVKSIDLNGNIKSIKTYQEVKGLIIANTIYVENNKLKYENLENNKVIEVCDWDDKYFYDTYTSKYYTRNELDNMNEKNKQEGLYIVVDYSGQKIDGNYGMEYCFKDNGEVITYPITHEIGGRAKPVLYLYPTKTTDVKVEFEHPEYLTTTYPKYNNSWKVKASPNGDLIDSNNKYYYGLYWDEIRYNEVDFHEGFYVTKDNAINFLEEKLDIIGLNPRERNEFIMYWLPILENNEKSIVYFELTKERERGNKLIITPKPDSMLRVSIHIKKVNDKVNIKEQKLETFKRYGFSVIEWGGMTY